MFHSAVIAYLDVPGRELLAALMRDLLTDPRLHWVSNERPRALPAVTATGPEPPPGRYVLGVDGHAVGGSWVRLVHAGRLVQIDREDRERAGLTARRARATKTPSGGDHRP